MKKIILACALAMGFGSVSAQTVMSSKFFENMYVNLNVAAQTDMHKFGEHVYPAADLYIGKWITPKFGAEINMEAQFHNGFKERNTVVDATYLGVNALFNMNNILHGYKGKPDFFEVVPFVGIGWIQAFGHLPEQDPSILGYSARTMCDNAALGVKAGLNLAFNLGKSRAWQINVRPGVLFATSRGAQSQTAAFQFDSRFGRVTLEAGFTYKFKNRYGTHNFVLAELRDQAEIDALNDRINYLNDELAKKPKEVVKTVTKEVMVQSEETSFLISFDKGSDKVKGNIAEIAAMLNKTTGTINITGNTSPEGSEKVNKALAIRRAEAAKQALIEAGVDASRFNILNNYEDKRNAVIKVVK